MVRNLYMVNVRASRPTRTCLYRTGPRDVALMSRAMATQMGAQSTTARLPTARSNDRFTMAWAPVRRTGRIDKASRSPTG